MTSIKENPLIAAIVICAILIATSGFVGGFTLTSSITKQNELEQKVTRLEAKIENMEANLKLIPSMAVSIGKMEERLKQWEPARN